MRRRWPTAKMCVVLDKLIVSPGGARALRTAYGRDLAAVLESAGLQMVSNPRIADPVAYVVQSGMVGTIGFVAPLTVECGKTSPPGPGSCRRTRCQRSR